LEFIYSDIARITKCTPEMHSVLDHIWKVTQEFLPFAGVHFRRDNEPPKVKLDPEWRPTDWREARKYWRNQNQ